jgi:hypothetical protein
MCGFDKQDIERANEFRVFVIGRNASYFSGVGTLDSRAAWGNWYQLLRLFTENITLTNPLAELHTLMIETSPLKKEFTRPPKEEIKIRDVTHIPHVPINF